MALSLISVLVSVLSPDNFNQMPKVDCLGVGWVRVVDYILAGWAVQFGSHNGSGGWGYEEKL